MERSKVRTSYLTMLTFVFLMIASVSAYADTGASGTCEVKRGQRNQQVCEPADEGTTCVRLNRDAYPPGQFGACTTLDQGKETSRCECVPNAAAAQVAQITRVNNALTTADYYTDVSRTISLELACAQINALANDILAAHVALSALGTVTFFESKTLGAFDEILLRISPFGSLVNSCGMTSFPSTTLFEFFLDLKLQMIDVSVAY